MTDPISDMLARIRNAQKALLPEMTLPSSKIKQSIAAILKKEGYISEFSVEGETARTLKLKLKYEGKKGVIEGMTRLSSPGLRRYSGATEFPRVLGGMGILIVSTSQGLMTGSEAARNKLGGELLCSVW